MGTFIFLKEQNGAQETNLKMKINTPMYIMSKKFSQDEIWMGVGLIEMVKKSDEKEYLKKKKKWDFTLRCLEAKIFLKDFIKNHRGKDKILFQNS